MVRNNSTFGSYARPNNWQGLCDQQCHGLVEFPASGLQIGNTAFVSDFNIKTNVRRLYVCLTYQFSNQHHCPPNKHYLCTDGTDSVQCHHSLLKLLTCLTFSSLHNQEILHQTINLNVDQILLRSESPHLIQSPLRTQSTKTSIFIWNLWLNRMSCLTFVWLFVFYFNSVLLLYFHSLKTNIWLIN